MRTFSRTCILSLLAVTGLQAQGTGKAILFDHTHHEEGGTSAEWVICSGHEPDPSPASPSKETDWNGGLSALAYDLHKQGYKLQTLPASGGRITYGDSSNAQDLSNYSVFFIPECYTYFSAAEKTAIVNYVKHGGGLFLLGNHDGAARVSSSVSGSTDAFHVFNDLASNNGVANNGFGLTWVDGHASGTAANTTSTAYSKAINDATTAIIRGPNGTLAMQDFHSFSYIQVSTANNPSAQGILSTQVSGDPASNYFLATCTFGSGRVVATGDSSPADDGTTSTSGKKLYDSYTINSNRAFFLNAIEYLAASPSAAQPPVVSISSPAANTTTSTGSTLTFQATAVDPAGSSMTYAWTFGDAATGSGLGPLSHAYLSAGTYTATFTATNAQGLSGSATRIITVNNPSGNVVTANLTTPAGNVTVASGAAVAFAGSGSDSSAQATLSYGWNFGDGASATGTSVSHVYTNTNTSASAASYTATFTVTDSTGVSASATRKITVNPSVGATLSEGFESGSKASYATGDVVFASGTWTLNDALLGTSTSDPKAGSQSVRLRNSGKLTMAFNWAGGAKTVSIKHAKYGSDGNTTWTLWYSTNGGSSWSQAGSSVTTSATTLQTASFSLNVTGAVRFELRKSDGSSNRLNVDDFQVAGN